MFRYLLVDQAVPAMCRSLAAARLSADCRRGTRPRPIGERLERDLAAFQTPPPAPYDACEKVPTSVSSLSLVRYRLNDYSVPTTYGHRDVLVRGYVHDVVISCGAEVIARHPRSHEREDFVFEAAALPGADRTEDQRARPGCAAGRLAVAGGVHDAAASSGSPDG